MIKRFHKVSLWFAGLMLLAAAIKPGASSVRASSQILPGVSEQSMQRCYALDVIFLIDQSDSMSGDDLGGAPNDKFENRIEAFRISVEWLAQNQYGLCRQAQHRVGAISFGSSTQVDLELRELPQDKETWDSIKDTFLQAVQSERLDNTDHALAFMEAREMLERNPAPDSSIPRKTALVMVTDGQPVVPGVPMDAYYEELESMLEDDFPFSESLRAREMAIRDLADIYGDFNQVPEEALSVALSDNPIDEDRDFQESTYIYILALNDATPYEDEVEDLFSSISHNHGGDFVDLSNNTSQIPLQFNEVLSRLAMIKIARGTCGTLYIQPYLSALSVNIYKNVEGVPITIHYGDPQNSQYAVLEGQGDTAFFGQTDYQVYGSTNEAYDFVSPKGGEWYVDAATGACEELHVVYQTFVPQSFELVAPEHVLPVYEGEQNLFNPQSPYYLAYRIQDPTVDGGPAIMVEDPDFPVAMEVAIVKPDGSTASMVMEYESTNQIWQSEDPVPVDQVGEYSVSIVSMTAPCVDPEACQPGRPYELFEDSLPAGKGAYQVHAVDHFGFEILSPTELQKLPIHGSLISEKYAERPVPVRVQLLDGSGFPISYKEILHASGQPGDLFQATLTLDNQQYGPIELNPGFDESVLEGEFLIDNPRGQGQGVIQVELVGSYNYDQFFTDQSQDQVQFIREDPLWLNPYILIGVAVIIGLIVIGVVLWLIYHLSRPLSGYLEFTHSQSESRALKVSIAKNWDRVTVKVPQQVGINKARVINQDGKSTEIRLEYKYRGKEEKLLLRPNQTKQMPGGIPFQVRYVGMVQKDEAKRTTRTRRYDPYRTSGAKKDSSRSRFRRR